VLGTGLPTFADLPKLPFARMVLQETLRLYPPAWQLPRLALRDDEIEGHKIPAGTTVVNMIYSCHRHPDVWPDPEHFDPERFLPERSEGRHKLAYMPFGAGQRLCIGKDFAMMEGSLALAMVAQRFHITPTTARPAQPQLTATLRIKGGVPVRLSKRI
jgi:cytochrome P450